MIDDSPRSSSRLGIVAEVHEHEVRLESLGVIDRLLARGGDTHDRMSYPTQSPAKVKAHEPFILDDQNPHRSHHVLPHPYALRPSGNACPCTSITLFCC